MKEPTLTGDSPAPVPSGDPFERIGVLDVLRGLALIGMYVVHFHNYASARPTASSDPFEPLLDRIVDLFFDARFYTIFGMLFGVGFAIQLARADGRRERFVARYLRRLLLLAVFGIVAEGIFGYNVLFSYAMWGAPLLLVRRWPIRALTPLLLLCAASLPLYNLARIAWYARSPDGMERFAQVEEAREQEFQAARADWQRTEASTDWSTVVAGRLRFMPKFHVQWSLLPWGPFTLFLLGLIGFRTGLFDRPEAHRRLIVALMIAGTASWVLATWVLPIGGPLPAAPSREGAGAVLEAAVRLAGADGFRLIRVQWLAFTYVGAVLLLVAANRAWLDRLAPLAWTGRMALTNYMSQVILLDVLFEPHGFGLTVSAAMVPVAALVLFGIQSLVGRWWLSRFRAGPLEWLWRCFTYFRWQPIRIRP